MKFLQVTLMALVFSLALQSDTSRPLTPLRAGNPPARSMLKNAKTVYVLSKTMFLPVDTLEHALTTEKDWPKLSVTMVDEKRAADVLIEVDRLSTSRIHTFAVV